MSTRKPLVLAAILMLTVAPACGDNDAPPPRTPTPTNAAPPATTPPPPVPIGKLTNVKRGDFNARAAALDLPFYWIADSDNDNALGPQELAIVWGVEPNARKERFIKDGQFTQHFLTLYGAIAAYRPPMPQDPKNAIRIGEVLKELAQARPTLVASDFRSSSEEDKTFVRHVESIATSIERLYQKQRGTWELRPRVGAEDSPSRMLFFRNQSPACEAPATQNDPACSAIPGWTATKVSGLYPADLVSKDKFCDALGKDPNKKLMDPFTVVVHDASGKLTAVPYSEFYKDDMGEISAELTAAANDIKDPKEAALKAYLTADAQAFKDNNWWPADEAWAKMSVNNSKWYLRIAPDETYSEPCSTKAMFQVSFGTINQKSLKWQSKLDPKKTDMENAVAAQAGEPYKARKVSFKLPDFMDVVLNAGDARPPSGATIGESLPNFGPVANEGRGRTVAMTNFYTDPDSVTALKSVADSLFCPATMTKYTSDPEPQLMTTILHEATHNLGPSAQYKVQGKIDRESFGGPLASMLEELKAQTGALFFTDWLVTTKDISQDDADKAHIRDLFWAFGHISRGMYDENKQPRTYSQLAAIQLGWLMKDGAVTWNADQNAANGTDKGCFDVKLDKFPASVKSMMKEVAGVKARGDKAEGQKLVHDYVDVDGQKKAVFDVITTRELRSPKPTFLYSIEL